MKKLPGIIQIFGLLGCILLPVVFINGLIFAFHENSFYLLSVPFLLLPALACRLLFEGDDSTLGKLFFNLGDYCHEKLFRHLIRRFLGYVRTIEWLNLLFRKNATAGQDTEQAVDRIINKIEQEDVFKH